MSDVVSFFLSLGKVVVLFSFLGGFIFLIGKGISPSQNFIIGIKYGMLKKKYNPKIVEECLTNNNLVEIKKKLILNGVVTHKNLDEVEYTFKKVEKEKNGGKNGKR